MRKGEQTRHAIIRKAAPIFNQKGYEDAALSDLKYPRGERPDAQQNVHLKRFSYPGISFVGCTDFDRNQKQGD